MKTPLGHWSAFALALVTLMSGAAPLCSAEVIARWTFETNPPADLFNSQTITGIAADFGSGTASGFHSSAATDWTTPAGNGSSNSLTANNWTTGDYFQFTFSTLGYEDVAIQFNVLSASGSPVTYNLFQVSPDRDITGAVGFTSGMWETSGLHGVGSPAFNLSTATFRVLFTGVTGDVGIDNFTVTATAVPETSPFVYGGLIVAGIVGWKWRQQRRVEQVLA